MNEIRGAAEKLYQTTAAAKSSMNLNSVEKETPDLLSAVDNIEVSYSSEKIKVEESPKLTSPRIPPYGTPEMYQPYILLSGKKGFSCGERVAPVKMNFDDDWDVKNNKENYKEKYYGNDKVHDVTEEQGAVYLHKMDSNIDGENYRVYQYWYYWPENPYYLDQHEHDLQFVMVYVKEDGIPKWVFTHSHTWAHDYRDEKKEQLDSALSVLEDIEKSEDPDFMIFGGSREDLKKATEGLDNLEDDSDSTKSYNPDQIHWAGSHPVVYIAQNSHAIVCNPKDFLLTDKCNRPYAYAGTVSTMIDLDDSSNPDNPLPNQQDIHKILDEDGNMKNHGFLENPFVKVKSPLVRKIYQEGAYGHTREG